MKICCIENCQSECEPGRRYCRFHYLERKREQAKTHYQENGKYTYKCVCQTCGREFEGDKSTSKFCSRECYNVHVRINSSNATNNYVKRSKTPKNEHRCIVEEILQRKLNENEVVHHLDCNPLNNDISNLVVLSRSDHAKLHSLLTDKRAALSKDKDVNSENCWDNLRDQITKTWLETANVNVIKISDIGQSSSRDSK